MSLTVLSLLIYSNFVLNNSRYKNNKIKQRLQDASKDCAQVVLVYSIADNGLLLVRRSRYKNNKI